VGDRHLNFYERRDNLLYQSGPVSIRSQASGVGGEPDEQVCVALGAGSRAEIGTA
jgi:hypothetical protein